MKFIRYIQAFMESRNYVHEYRRLWGTVINSTLGLLCRHPGFTAEIYGHLIISISALHKKSQWWTPCHYTDPHSEWSYTAFDG